MMLLWASAGVPLGTYNIVEEFNIALRIQPQILTLLSLITWSQCQYYGQVRRGVIDSSVDCYTDMDTEIFYREVRHGDYTTGDLDGGDRNCSDIQSSDREGSFCQLANNPDGSPQHLPSVSWGAETLLGHLYTPHCPRNQLHLRGNRRCR